MKNIDDMMESIEQDTIKLMKRARRAYKKKKDMLSVAANTEAEFQRIWGMQDEVRFEFYPPLSNDAIDLALASSRGFLLGFVDWAEDAELKGKSLTEATEFTYEFLIAMAYWVPRLAMAIDLLSANYEQMKKDRKGLRSPNEFLSRLYPFVLLSKKIREKKKLFS